MKVLNNIKRVIESIEAKKGLKTEDHAEFAEIIEKHKDIPVEKLTEIIEDVKAALKPVEEVPVEEPVEEVPVTEEDEDEVDDEIIIQETGNEVDVKPAEKVEEPGIVDANKAESAQKNELDASEEKDEVKDEIIVEEDEIEDIPAPEKEEEPAEDVVAEEDEEDFDVYKDELDIVDEEGEKPEEIDDTIPAGNDGVEAAEKYEDAEEIDTVIPDEETGVEAADAAEKEPIQEANTAAKAAIANKENKGAFSADVDELTKYLDEY